MIRMLFLLILWGSTGFAAVVGNVVRDGDIIFQTSRSSQSVAVQRATHSPYSHVGIIFQRNGNPYVLEASSTVEFTPLSKWIERGIKGHYVVKRLAEAPTGLTVPAVQKLSKQALSILGKPYDLAFEWTDDRFYCSELVWKLYERALGIQLGKLQHLHEFNLSDPIVSAKLRERYGDRIPFNESVISPAAIFACQELTTIATH